MKNILRSVFLFAAFFGAIRLSQGQAQGPTVEVPTSRYSAIIEIPTTRQAENGSVVEPGVSVGGEYKQTQPVVEQEKPRPVNFAWYVQYQSQYNFRGTNLTPGADGAIFVDAEVSKWGFTLGA